MNNRLLPVLLVLLLITVGVGTSANPEPRTLQTTDTNVPKNAAIPDTALQTTTTEGLHQGTCDYRRLFSKASQAVVLIAPFNETRAFGQASGWVYRVNDSTAYIVTNWHVAYYFQGSTARKPTNYSVKFTENRWRTAELVAADNTTDTAVLRVENPPAGVTPLQLAREPAVRGQPMAVLGSPFGHEDTVTQGIVSGVDRVGTFRYPGSFTQTMTALLQSSAAVTFGNSGGPWVNCHGRVIGMSLGGVPRTEVDFAVSTPVLRDVLPILLANRTPRHSLLGVETISVTPRLATANEFNITRGVMVTSVSSNGPAAGKLQSAPYIHKKSGLPAGGDVILAIDGSPIADREDLLTYLLLETRPNETVNLTVLRDGENRTVPVTLGLRPAKPPRPEPQNARNETTTVTTRITTTIPTTTPSNDSQRAAAETVTVETGPEPSRRGLG